METARHMADSLCEAVNHEETLRSQLRKELGPSKESFAIPDRSFTNSEMKYIGEAAAKLGDAALLDVITGAARPQGRLPFELPSSMAEVEAQRSDIPHDTAHPLYPIGFGLRYSRATR